jgi:hypothetical protein
MMVWSNNLLFTGFQEVPESTADWVLVNKASVPICMHTFPNIGEAIQNNQIRIRDQRCPPVKLQLNDGFLQKFK